MRYSHCLMLGAVIALSAACSNAGGNKYEPLDGYNGKVKKLVTYTYESDIQKNRIISKYGCMIPESIKEYSNHGLLERKISIRLPEEDDDYEVCVVYVDSMRYNNQNQEVYSARYKIFVTPDEVALYGEPEKLINSNTTFWIKYENHTKYVVEGDIATETKVVHTYRDINKLSTLPASLERDIRGWLKYLDIYTPEASLVDTVIRKTEYKNGKLVREIESQRDKYWETLNQYENGLLVGSTRISQKDTTYIKYTYRDGVLWEEDNGFWTTRYDEKGRVIYRNSKNGSETVRTYKDTSTISTSSGKYGTTVSLETVNKDSLSVLTVSIDLKDRDYYVDDALILLEKFRDGEIPSKDFEREVEKIVLKIDESGSNRIETTTYSEYDTYNNPLKIVKKKIRLSNKYSFSSSYLKYYLDRGFNRYEDKEITEKAIEYYE